MSLKFTEKDVAQDSVICFAQVQKKVRAEVWFKRFCSHLTDIPPPNKGRGNSKI